MASVTQYKTILDGDGLCKLVKERAVNYQGNWKFGSPKSIYEMLCKVFQHDKQSEEFLYLLCFNNKARLLGVFELSHGGVSSTICSTREIFQKALLCNAAYIILAHNHPSGDVTPSKEDFVSYSKVKQASRVMDVPLRDNLIVGNNSYYSFAEMGVL